MPRHASKISGVPLFISRQSKLAVVLLVLLLAANTYAQSSLDSTAGNTAHKKSNKQSLGMEVYGFILADVIYDFKQMDPKWFDVPRPTKLPTYKNQFGPDGQVYFSMRQTRFGVRGYSPTPFGELRSWFEFDLFGSGADAGQTTFHLRHAYGEIGKIGAGQTWSPFMDVDVIPNDLEYWGPNGMVFIRNIQLRYMPIQGNTRLTIALEKPGATADDGVYGGRIELQNVKANFTLPDLTAEYRYGASWGYVELAGILRQLKWKDLDPLGPDLSGQKTGWGLNLSSRIKVVPQDNIHLQVLYGEGIENYVRDAPADVSVKTLNNGAVEGVALPILGIVGFYDHYWNKKFSSTIGYSQVKITNSNGQSPDAFKIGKYALTDLIYSPVDIAVFEIELQYLKRKNFSDGWTATDPRIQFSFRFNFSQKFYHEINTTP